MNEAYFHAIEGAGLVRILGETRQDYLQRQSSNDIGLLSSISALPNILTAPTGKILEIFTVIDDGDGYMLATPAARGSSLSSYFQARIFFNDQVEIHDNSKDWIQFKLIGSQWIEIFSNLFKIEINAQLNSVSVESIGEWELRFIVEKNIGIEPSFLLLAPSEAGPKLKSIFDENGAINMGDSEMEALRISSATLGPGEIFGDFTPFEIGLDDRVSSSKGCYPGQEVLARQITYDKVTRSLVKLTANGPAAVGMNVLGEGKIVGKVTSANPKETGSFALAVVKKPFNKPGAKIQLKNQEQTLLAKILSPAF